MRSIKIFCLLCILFFFNNFYSQEKGKSGPKEKTIKQELKSNRQLKREKKEKRRKERAERKAVKQYHKRLQTKQVRKRMKSSRKTAIRNNDNKREFFVKRWFKRKKKLR